MNDGHGGGEAVPLNIAVLTVSDSRTLENDRSGGLLAERLRGAGHRLATRRLLPDDLYAVRAAVAAWIADPTVDVVLTTGGTGFSARDVTPQAVAPLLDLVVEGFGELFRSLSREEIGSSTLQSRALAGLANRTLVCCLPGSPGACALAWDGILAAQLDARNRPCNFVNVLRGDPGASK
ncbi:MAG TPA: molybdenum cofactor biosynthesis protein B [Gammaproteobacteria bacterium]|nr:molybdenum cofactor biosynthesis protein B [Gammaproteobacteria bacterium]